MRDIGSLKFEEQPNETAFYEIVHFVTNSMQGAQINDFFTSVWNSFSPCLELVASTFTATVSPDGKVAL